MSAKLVTYVLIRQPGKAFLVQYPDGASPNPRRSGWWVPAPELSHGEHPEDAARRVLASLGVPEAKPRLAGVDSFVTRDWHVLFLYVADVATMPVPDTTYATGRWFALDDLPSAKDLAHGAWEGELVKRLSSAPAG